MHILGLIFFVALATSLALTPLARMIAVRLGAVDRPDGKRKLQKRPVPRWGGVAVYAALLAGLAGARGCGLELPAGFDALAAVIAVSAGFVCLIGCVDDRWELRAKHKLPLQIAAVLPAVLAGVWLDDMKTLDSIALFGHSIELGWLGVPLTVLWLVGCINALNLVDGMDGLASVVGLSTAGILAFIAASLGNGHVALAAVGLAGALLGFLVYNLPPARIYLGDSGSMVIGLVLGILGIQGSLKTATTLSITAPAVVMTIPLLDTALAILRRKLTGQRFDTPDRGHIHHRLLDRGLSAWQALCIIGSLSLATGAAAAAATIVRSDILAWLVTLGLVVLMIRLRTFGHHEVALVKRQTASLLSRWARGLSLSADPLRRRLTPESLSFEEAWSAIVGQAAGSGCQHLAMTLCVASQRRAQHTWKSQHVGETQRVQEARRIGDVSSAPAGGSDAWSLEFVFGQDADVSCRLSAQGLHPPGADAWQLWQLVELLRTFGPHWQAHPDQAPMVLPLERATTAPARPLRSAA